jgi:hypothetical protein
MQLQKLGCLNRKSHDCVNLKISTLFQILNAGKMMSQINLIYSPEAEDKNTKPQSAMTCIILAYFFCLLILYKLQKRSYAAENNRIIMTNELEIMLKGAVTEYFKVLSYHFH